MVPPFLVSDDRRLNGEEEEPRGVGGVVRE